MQASASMRRYKIPPTGTQKQPRKSVNAYFFHISAAIGMQAFRYCRIYEKTTLRLFARLFFRWCRRSDSNRHG